MNSPATTWLQNRPVRPVGRYLAMYPIRTGVGMSCGSIPPATDVRYAARPLPPMLNPTVRSMTPATDGDEEPHTAAAIQLRELRQPAPGSSRTDPSAPQGQEDLRHSLPPLPCPYRPPHEGCHDPSPSPRRPGKPREQTSRHRHRDLTDGAGSAVMMGAHLTNGVSPYDAAPGRTGPVGALPRQPSAPRPPSSVR